MKSNLKFAGYDPEEIYFYRKEKELIEKMQSQAKLELIQGGKVDEAKSDVKVEAEKTNSSSVPLKSVK